MPLIKDWTERCWPNVYTCTPYFIWKLWLEVPRRYSIPAQGEEVMHQHTPAVWEADSSAAAWRTFTSLCSSVRLDALFGWRPEQDSLFPVVFLYAKHITLTLRNIYGKQKNLLSLNIFPRFTVCEHCRTVRPNQCCIITMEVHYLHMYSNKKWNIEKAQQSLSF